MCKPKKCKTKKSKCKNCEEINEPEVNKNIPLKTNTAIMALTIKANYIVDLDEDGVSPYHKTGDLQEITMMDAFNITHNNINLSDFLLHFCQDIKFTIEPLGIQKSGNS